MYKVILFESGNHRVVEEFIFNLDSQTFDKVLFMFDALEEYGWKLRWPHVKKITNKLFELRIRTKEQVRLLFVIIGLKIYILHGFKKKKNKIPPKEIETANNRLTRI